MRVKWLTKKVKTLFRVKEKTLHPACKVYEDVVCSCGESYISETVRNVELRLKNNSIKNTNPLKHIKDIVDHVFNWSVLNNARKNMFQ